MAIYGVALLALCTLTGLLIGEALGRLLGVPANVGGVGIAMLLLIFASDWLTRRDMLTMPSRLGIEFWSAIYVPIVVAMAAQQNVVGAISEGMTAILAGAAAVAAGFVLVPVLAGKPEPPSEPPEPLDQPPEAAREPPEPTTEKARLP
jgi:malonate transporter MadL subunit